MQLKPHDTVVALKYGCLVIDDHFEAAGEKVSIRAIASSLGLSPGEISKSNQRLLKARLIAPADPKDQIRLPYNVVRTHMEEWSSYGIRYCVVAEPVGVGRGLVTGWSNPAIHSEFVARELPYVWLVPGGDTTGEGITPLYPKAAIAASQDKHLHYVLSLIDAIRLGRPRELRVARDLLREFLLRL